MAMYFCDLCGELLDDDEAPCDEHPTAPTEFCCEPCATEYRENQEKVNDAIEAANCAQEDVARERMNFAKRGLEA